MPRKSVPLIIEPGPARDRILERFYDYMAAEGPDSCWEWLGALNLGYGSMWLPGKIRPGAHRVAYALFKGPLPDESLTIDHTCRNKACVNPDHLELVTFAENLRRRRLDVRGEKCPRGHDFVSRGEGNQRACSQCARDSQREYQRTWRAKQRAAAVLPHEETTTTDAAWGACTCGHGPGEHDAVVVRPVAIDPPARVLFEGTLGRCSECACVMWASASLATHQLPA